MAYSTDLRERTLEYIEAGNTITEASRIFNVTRQTIRKWRKLKEATGSVEREIYRHGAIKLDDQELIKYVQSNPDLCLKDYAKKFNMSPSGIWRAFERLHITLKKANLYKERNEEKRDAYKQEIAPLKKENIVYIDESGIEECLHRDCSWALRGVPVYGEVSGRKYERESFIAGQVGNRIIAPFCFKGTCNTQFFNTWIKRTLIPALKPGQIVVMDNASFHKSARTKELIESAGCRLVFLPPYSPDLNPIEKFWANFKRSLSKIIHDFNSLSDALDFLFKQICNGN